MHPTLAIDYGEKYIGIAISDSTGLIATPLEVFQITEKTPLEANLQKIAELATEYRAKSILFGVPQAFTKAQEKSVQKAQDFIDIAIGIIKLPYTTTDESFSTSTAQNVILSTSRRVKKKGVDKIAAAVFLQEYLDRNPDEKDLKTNN